MAQPWSLKEATPLLIMLVINQYDLKFAEYLKRQKTLRIGVKENC